MKTILVPTDFSTNALNAGKLARILSTNSGATVHFFHVVFTPTDWDKMTDEMKEQYPESKQKVLNAEKSMSELIAEPSFLGAPVDSTIGFGNPTEKISAFIKNNAIDLVVVGSHGTSHKADLFIGSNTQRIMRNTNVPVIAVKEDFKLDKINKVVFASNMDTDAVEPYKKLEAICNALTVDLALLYVNTPHNFKSSEEIDTVISSFQKSINNNSKVAIRNDYDVAQGILTYCQTNDVDMTALVNHRKAVAAHYLMGVTETLVFRADFPVISIKA